jgi:hypothetical protein
MADHVHMMISIPPKHAVSQLVGFIKGNPLGPGLWGTEEKGTDWPQPIASDTQVLAQASAAIAHQLPPAACLVRLSPDHPHEAPHCDSRLDDIPVLLWTRKHVPQCRHAIRFFRPVRLTFEPRCSEAPKRPKRLYECPLSPQK